MNRDCQHNTMRRGTLRRQLTSHSQARGLATRVQSSDYVISDNVSISRPESHAAAESYLTVNQIHQAEQSSSYGQQHSSVQFGFTDDDTGQAGTPAKKKKGKKKSININVRLSNGSLGASKQDDCD